MSALPPCCLAEEEENCNCNKVAVKKNPTIEQLSTIENDCKCILLSSDSSRSLKDEYIIEGYAPAGNHRPQSVKRSLWDEFEREKQKFRNPKIPGIFCSACSLAIILMSVETWSF